MSEEEIEQEFIDLEYKDILEITEWFRKLHSVHHESFIKQVTGKELWDNLKLMEAIRRRYEKNLLDKKWKGAKFVNDNRDQLIKSLRFHVIINPKEYTMDWSEKMFKLILELDK